MDIFSMGGAPEVPTEYRYPEIPEFGIRELLTLEKESSGMYFSGHIIEVLLLQGRSRDAFRQLIRVSLK